MKIWLETAKGDRVTQATSGKLCVKKEGRKLRCQEVWREIQECILTLTIFLLSITALIYGLGKIISFLMKCGHWACRFEFPIPAPAGIPNCIQGRDSIARETCRDFHDRFTSIEFLPSTCREPVATGSHTIEFSPRYVVRP